MLNSARYKAFLTAGSSGTLTPDFTKVQLTHSGTSTSMLQVFAFDEAGNMTSKTTETASGTSTDDRTSFVVGTITNGSSTVSSVSTADLALLAVGETISHAAFPAGTTVSSKGASSFVASANATASATGATIGFENRLNQIMRQVVTPAGGSATTWRYAYNANGCMTSKTDGTNTWTLTWDDDNRLTRVQGPGGVDVSYQYDSLGRMLTRVSGGVTTRYTWDGWNCVKEDDGTNVFRWYCPEGELHSFERNSTFYQVHSDALGSVRAITDSSGVVVGSYSYGAWGETTSASHPSGFTMPYGYVGGLGVRYDSVTGLHYMRNRWYDAGLGRFLSRDPIFAQEEDNLYIYALNSPQDLTDPLGLQPPPYDDGSVMPPPLSRPGRPQPFRPQPGPSPEEPVKLPPGVSKAGCFALCFLTLGAADDILIGGGISAGGEALSKQAQKGAIKLLGAGLKVLGRVYIAVNMPFNIAVAAFCLKQCDILPDDIECETRKTRIGGLGLPLPQDPSSPFDNQDIMPPPHQIRRHPGAMY